MPQNQERYLRALATLPSVSLHFGTFRADKRWMAVSPLSIGADGEPQRVRVRKIEEKGTDVSLAAHMVADAMEGIADAYFLLSNDSDFVDALRIVRERARKEIGLIVPTESAAARRLLELRPEHIRPSGQAPCSTVSSRRGWSTNSGASGRHSAGEVQKPLSHERGFAPVSR